MELLNMADAFAARGRLRDARDLVLVKRERALARCFSMAEESVRLALARCTSMEKESARLALARMERENARLALARMEKESDRLITGSTRAWTRHASLEKESDRLLAESTRVVEVAAIALYGEGAVIDWAAHTARPKEA